MFCVGEFLVICSNSSLSIDALSQLTCASGLPTLQAVFSTTNDDDDND